ncbi:MAG: SpoIIE family protein phosphatase [Kofleriaceae bacterium]|nr:SpoIIE family protein phosphatase [Kofleriaceae bacterium]
MSCLSWGCAGHPLAGESSSGDRGVVLPFPGGALVAVIDGLGHGKDACLASERAEQVLSGNPAGEVTELVKLCHTALRTTRGAVMSLASFDAERGTMTWLGVGNVEAILVRAEPGASAEAVAMRGGTIGYMLPPLHPRTLVVHPGDTLVLATDGIRHGFRDEVRAMREPQEIADAIVANWSKADDDAYAIVARYLGLVDATKIDIGGEADVAHVRIKTRDAAHGLGFAGPDVEAIATAVSEIVRNVVEHAHHGEVVLRRTRDRVGLAVVVRDRGPGIADIARALEDHFSTGRGLGCGLSGARRLVDKLEIDTQVGVGTVVTIEKWLR